MTHTFENRLKNSASPYLRSAAHQPVDWHEWGEAAFQKARAEGKPVLLDIGAVWCHWCHVIDRESYENPEIAAMINELFIPVKVDRDERPDVDARYQSAVSAISGQGGWPLTAFLTPDGKPFFGGTYFPPDDAMGRPGFRRILESISETFQTRRAEVNSSAKAVEEAVAKAEMFEGAQGKFDTRVLDQVIEAALGQFDDSHGGFGHAPKFPHASAVDLLLEAHLTTHDEVLLEVAERTLEAMALGGVYDQLGGGFHRYSVDERWCVPHFEKMSYDNSELLKNFAHGWQVTRKPLFRETAEGIIAWVGEVLSDPERGGFYSSQDADQTLDDDGDYFTWTLGEVRAALTPKESRAVEIYYDVEAKGEMQHDPERNVLWVAASIEQTAEKLRLDEASARILLARARGKLLAARRERRPVPSVDETIYTAWNAMFVSAYLDAARAFNRPDCRDFALKTLERILAESRDETKRFLHRPGRPRIEGTLEDHVFAAGALLDAYETTLDRRYFDTAERTMRLAIERFGDTHVGGFFDRAKDAAPMGGLEVRRKPMQDSPTPGANPAAAIVLDRLYSFTGDEFYRQWAEKTLETFTGVAARYGLFAGTYGLATLLHSRLPLQVVITGVTGDRKAAELERAAHEIYRFGKAVLRVTPERLVAGCLPTALHETLVYLDAGKAQALVCVKMACCPPVTEPQELSALLIESAADAARGSK
jgi:uncharacterized protein YyaL (SSP411 family)